MSALLSTPARRITFALAVSLLLHGWLMWQPHIRLPRHESNLPPLLAHLQPLPAIPAKFKSKQPARTATPVSDSKTMEAPPPLPPEDVATTAQDETAMTSMVVAASAVAAESAVAATTPSAQPTTEKAPERPLLPHRARLTFAVNKGTGDFQVGEAVHTLEIEDGHYVLQAVTRTVGVARLFKSYQLTQYSSGRYVPLEGLQPEHFFEERAEKSGTQHIAAEFDWPGQRVHFSQGGAAGLPPGTQDILSILYQFPATGNAEKVSTHVSNGRKIEQYEFEVSTEDDTATPVGPLHTIHLRKLHAPGEEGLEIWLAREYRLFPVKMRIIEKNGEVSGQIAITDIRVEDAPQETTQNAAH